VYELLRLSAFENKIFIMKRIRFVKGKKKKCKAIPITGREGP
jgi:hypothetical protein